MASKAIEVAINEAVSRGLRVERLPVKSKRHIFDQRRALIEGKRCQVIPSRRGHPSVEYPYSEYFPLYVPRAAWADYLIYVSLETDPVFWIVPRLDVSKDTGWTPESLEPYREAWQFLQIDPAPNPKGFEILSWQMQTVKLLAENAGLDVEFLNRKKRGRWPPLIKRRVIVAGKKCAIFSATRISQDISKPEYNYAVFKASEEEWADFQLHIIEGTAEFADVFVVPSGHLPATTSASLNHRELARYKNAWGLLTCSPESLASVPPIQWKEPTVPASPTKHSILLQQAIQIAESKGLITQSQAEVSSYRGGQSFLYISGKRCQVMRATYLEGSNGFRSLSMGPPTSQWPEFVVFHAAESNGRGGAKFYIVPRTALSRRTSHSLQSPWLKQYDEAWHLLR
jgi:hypothetical protein